MRTGAFFEENRPNRTREQGAEKTGSPYRKRRKRKNRTPLLLAVLAFILVVLVVLAVFLSSQDNNPIQGKWDMDGVTVYEFGDSGRGSLILPSAQYDFTYKISDDDLQILFEYEGAKDAKYSFKVEGDTLTLIGGNETTKGTYKLSRID